MRYLTTLLLTCCALSGCDQEEPVRKFKQGDLVELVLSGHKAQVIRVNFCRKAEVDMGHSCTYDLRVYAPQSYTGTHLLGSDGPISSYAIATLEYVREYEMRALK